MKHISKILAYLEMTPDMLLGNVEVEHNLTKKLRSIFKRSLEQIANATGVSEERLKEIEGGAFATITELRDIAACLSVSVSCLRGNNFFEPQIAEPGIFLELQDDDEMRGCGFWGHIGIKVGNCETHSIRSQS